jgi:type IV pilus assembly protein PilV
MRASLMANEAIALMWQNGKASLTGAQNTSWNNRLANASISGLPNGVGTVAAPDSNGITWITITWQAPSRTTTSKYITQLVMPLAE